MAYDVILCVSDMHHPYSHPDTLAFLKALKKKYVDHAKNPCIVIGANPNGLFWGLQCGCLIDDANLAYAYNKINLKRPLIGCGVIVNGQPKLVPMILNSKGRWIKELR